MAEKQKTKHIGAKFSEEGANKLRTITSKLGMKSPYALVQTFCDCFLRYCDEPSETDKYFQQLFVAFDGLSYWTTCPSLTAEEKPNNQKFVDKAIYFLDKKGKDNNSIVLCEHKEDQITICYNVDTILELVLKNVSPVLYFQLMRLMQREKINSITYLIRKMYEQYLDYEDNDNETILDLFSDNENSFVTERNSIPRPELKYKRHNHRDIEKIGSLEKDNNKKNKK